MRVVIPIVAGVGNALMAVPMVRQLKRNHPEARITIIARIDAMAEPFRRLPEVEEVIVARKPIDSIRQTRARRPDVYLVPFPSNRWQYSLLQFASGARRRIMHGYPVGHWRAMHFLLADRLPAERGLHDVVQNLRLLSRLGVVPDETEAPQFLLKDEDRRRADELLAGVSEPFIAVHAGSARTILAQAKRWPAGKYAELIARMNYNTVLLEGPDEVGVADGILAGGSGANCPGLLPIKVVRLSGPLGDAGAGSRSCQTLCGVGFGARASGGGRGDAGGHDLRAG